MRRRQMARRKRARVLCIRPSALRVARIGILILLLDACALSVSGPVIVVPKNGEEPLRGTVTVTPAGGQFGLANSKLQCSGEYPLSSGSAAVTITTKCSDGRTGTGVAVRTAPRGGRGTIKMSDGTEAIFAYGSEVSASEPFEPPSKDAPVTPVPQPTAAQPSRAPNEEQRAAMARFSECGGKAIAYLDDGLSSAEGVAEAVLAACRPEIESLCQASQRRFDISTFCTPTEIAEEIRNTRPTIAAKVLEFRATRRFRQAPRQNQPGVVHPSDLRI